MRGKNLKIILTASVLLLSLVICTPCKGKIVYVDSGASGVNNGSCWENAYSYLQDALADANSAEKPVEIRVAQGVYTPDRGASITRGDRGAVFQLINDVTIQGGFAGVGNEEPGVRNFETYGTILSGDLAGDDAEVDDPDVLSLEPTRAENSSMVILAKGTDQTAVLDGVTVTAGYAGMVISRGDATVVNCTFTNTDLGLHISNSNSKIINCTFKGHWLHAILQSRSNLTVTDCIFTSNSSILMQSVFSYELILRNCTFVNNIANGAIYCSFQENLRLYNCKFCQNVFGPGDCLEVDVEKDFIAENCIFTGNIGGVTNNGKGRLVISNCIFTGNSRGFYSSGIHSKSQNNIIRNCTFSGNSSQTGGGVLDLLYGAEVTNCIFWDNSQLAIDARQDEPLVRYCNVQGGWPGKGNIDVDPYFVSPGYWDQNGTPDDTSDDFWVDGDYHLKSQAGRWDPVSESWVIDDVTSPCIDAGDPLTPVMYEPHPRGYFINMGAYGGTEKASKSYIDGSS